MPADQPRCAHQYGSDSVGVASTFNCICTFGTAHDLVLAETEERSLNHENIIEKRHMPSNQCRSCDKFVHAGICGFRHGHKR